MKNWIKKAMFGMHVAWRNMRIHPFRTILLMIGFLGISMTVMLALSMTDIFYTYFYGDLVTTYQDIDLKISVDKDGQTRFFSTTQLDDNIYQSVDGIYPFFEYEALVEVSNEDRGYAHIYASSEEMLAHLSDAENIEQTSLSDNEVIITTSYAENHNLQKGDVITFNVNHQSKAFDIVNILPDGKLFSGESVFIDKQASLSFFLSALDPTLAGLPEILLRNIYNVLYVDVKDGVAYDDVVTAFQTYNNYDLLNYTETIDEVSVNQLVERNTSLLGGLLSFVFIAIILVLQTTLKYFFHDRKRQSTLIHVLGGRQRFAFSVLAIELTIEEVLAFILGVVLANASIAFGMKYLESAWIYKLSYEIIGISFVISLFIFVTMFAYYSYQNRKQTDASQMKLEGDERQLNWKLNVIVAGVSLSVFALLYLPFFSHMLGHYASVIRVVLSVIILLFIAPVLLYIMVLYANKFKERKRTYYHLRILSGKKGFSHYFTVSLIVSLVIFLLILMMQHLNYRVDTISNEYDFDLIMTRMLGQEETVYDEILALDHVESANRADIYESVDIVGENKSINYVMSMESDDLDTYFNLIDLDQAITALEAQTSPAIILPISYHEIYGYNQSDNIRLTLSNDQPDQTFIIAGFFEKQGLGIAFTNLYMIDSTTRNNANSILIKASGDVQVLSNQLLDAYSDQMIIVFDFWTNYLNPYIFSMIRVKNFIIGYLSLVMICFIMTLANHQTMMQIEKEADDARMIAIGYQMKDLQKQTIIEGLIVLSIVTITSITSYLLIVGQIEGLFIAFGAYEHIVFKPISILFGLLINSLLFTIMWFARLKQQPSMHLMDYIRVY